MMRADPRSVYRKNRGSDRLYFTTVDTVIYSFDFGERKNIILGSCDSMV